MIDRRTLIGAGVLGLAGAAQAQPPAFSAVAYDRDFWRLIAPDVSARVLADGGDLGVAPQGEPDYGASLESPLWVADGGYLLVSDIPQDRIMKWTPDGALSVFRQPTGHANGLWLDQQGRLLMAQHSGRQVVRLERDGSQTVIMRSYREHRLNRPNTVVVRSDGGIYFSDFGFRTGAPEDWDVDFEGVYYVSPDLGTRALLLRDVIAPHKLLFSRDERTLYIGQYHGILAYDVADLRDPDPQLNQRGGRLLRDSRRWFWQAGAQRDPQIITDLVARDAHFVDGMKLDVEGNIWVGGNAGVWVISAAGRLLGHLEFGQSTPNICFGGSDMKTLFVVANHTLFSLPTHVAGWPIPNPRPS